MKSLTPTFEHLWRNVFSVYPEMPDSADERDKMKIIAKKIYEEMWNEIEITMTEVLNEAAQDSED